jgi:hypothetical protein
MPSIWLQPGTAGRRKALFHRADAMRRVPKAVIALVLAGATSLLAGTDKPYFVTYNSQMEEPGNLEISLNSNLGMPDRAPGFLASWMELEYGAKGWWTTEFYLEGQSTARDSTLFTGFRWENRVRPLAGQHWIDPVLYLEYENVSSADKALLEVVGRDTVEDLAVKNAEARLERKHELEGKLILSSDYKGWNLSENLIAEKNLRNGPWEFGYALGVSRPLALAASAARCKLCGENLLAGIELYGGLGSWRQLGLWGTSHYVGPILAWNLSGGTTLRVSPNFGLNHNSARALIRFGVSYEIPRFDRQVRNWFH